MFYTAQPSSLPPSRASSLRPARRRSNWPTSEFRFLPNPRTCDSSVCREPEILSCVLEFLYKGDYYPRLLHNKRRDTWELEDTQDAKRGGRGSGESTIYLSDAKGDVLRDTLVYCAAEKFGLEDLKRLALRKQGLQSGIQVDVILRSARYAYDNTPDTESRLRAHYLALIIRSRKTFKRSGTMQMEMENGGKLFFDLFVAMCNHIDDIVEIRYDPTPQRLIVGLCGYLGAHCYAATADLPRSSKDCPLARSRSTARSYD